MLINWVDWVYGEKPFSPFEVIRVSCQKKYIQHIHIWYTSISSAVLVKSSQFYVLFMLQLFTNSLCLSIPSLSYISPPSPQRHPAGWSANLTAICPLAGSRVSSYVKWAPQSLSLDWAQCSMTSPKIPCFKGPSLYWWPLLCKCQERLYFEDCNI